jgi:hypothetical protein
MRYELQMYTGDGWLYISQDDSARKLYADAQNWCSEHRIIDRQKGLVRTLDVTPRSTQMAGKWEAL